MMPWHPPPVRARRDFLRRGAGVFAACLCGGLGGCGAPVEALPIASHVWPGYEFMRLGASMGHMEAGQVRFVDTQSASASLQALAEGRALGAALTLDEVLTGIHRGLPLVVPLLFDSSAGADVVLVRPRITSLQQLRGARIGVETTALGALMLKKLLERAGLNRNDVEVVHFDVDEHVRAWADARLDALITYEPTSSRLQAAGAGCIFDSRDIPNTILDVLAVKASVLETHGAQLRALIRAHFAGLDAWKSNPVDAAYRMSGRLAVDPNAVAALYRGLNLPDLDYNHHVLSAPADELRKVARDVASVIGVAEQAVGPGLFVADCLPEAQV